MKTILVTGGGGFIGSCLVAALLDCGTHHIVICDTFGSSEKWRNLRKHAVSEIITPEVLFDWLEAHRQNVDMIYHVGGVSSTVEKNVDLVLRNNFLLSMKLWRWCDANSVRLVYNSSYAVYGDGGQGFDDTIDLAYLKKLLPMSCYGWSKAMFDIHVAGAVARNEIHLPQWVGLRLFNVYGPNEYHKEDQQSVISKIAPYAMRSGTVKLFRSYNPAYPDGGQKRDVLYVQDCVKVLLWFLAHPEVSGLFNLGSGKASSFNEMAAGIYAALNKPPQIHYIDMPESLAPNYQYFTEANVQRLRAAGYTSPFMPLQEGIKDYVQNYLMKPDPYL